MDTIKSKYLEKIAGNYQLLSELVLRQLSNTRMILDQPEANIYEEIEKNEVLIDSLDVKMREEVLNGIVFFNPKATDLRRIMAYHDTTKDLERIGDQILNVSDLLKKTDLNRPDFPEFKKRLSLMLKNAEEMVRGAVYAFIFEDTSKAYQTIVDDDKLDDMLRKITGQLHLVFQEKMLYSHDLFNITSISTIAHNIERIGDNATNIAEVAVYLMEGKDIRHGNA